MKVDIKCTKHPKYIAIEYPYSCCNACQVLYWLAEAGYRDMPDDSRLRAKGAKPRRKTRKKP